MSVRAGALERQHSLLVMLKAAHEKAPDAQPE